MYITQTTIRLVGYGTMLAGYLCLTNGLAGAFSNSALLLTSILGGLLILGRERFVYIIKMPKKGSAKWIIGGYFAYMITSALMGYLTMTIGWAGQANPVIADLRPETFILIPIMLMGEEIVSIVITEDLSDILGFWKATIVAGIIFALMHYTTYDSGHIVKTLIHILTFQGVARVIMNIVYYKTGRSIWGSWMTHMMIDIITLLGIVIFL